MAIWRNEKKGYWVAKFQHLRKQYKREGFRTRREAVLWEAEKRRELNAEPISETPSVSFQELATLYLEHCRARMQLNTVRQKAFVFRSFIAFMGDDYTAASIMARHISEYLNIRASENGNKAANRDLRDIKALYNWAIRQEVIECKNPCRSIEKYPEEPYKHKVPAPEDIDKVRMAADRDERDLIETVYHLAARIGEIKRLTWDDVNFEKRWIRLYTRKRRGGELQEDYQPMNKTLFEVLKARWERRDRSRAEVFYFTTYDIRYMLDRLCKKAEVAPFGFHSIRHHVLSVLNDTGKLSMKQMQRIARHRRQSTTEIYLHSISHDLEEAFRILDEVSKEEGEKKRGAFAPLG